MMMKLVVIRSVSALLMSTVAATAVAKSKERCVDYKKVNDVLYAVDHRARSKYVYSKATVEIKDERIKVSDIRIWLVRGVEKIRDVEVTQDRVVDLPAFDPKIADEIQVCLNQAKGAVSIRVDLGVHPPSKHRVSYRELFVLLDDANDFISEMAGFFSWFIADRDVLEFKFDREATIQILSKTRPRTFKSSSDLKIAIEHHRGWMNENPDVLFSALPVEMSAED